MGDRRDRLARAVDLTQKLWRLQQTRFAQAEADLLQLNSMERASFDALESGQLDPKLVLSQLDSISSRRREAEAIYEKQLAIAREHGQRARLTEKLYEKADSEHRRNRLADEMRLLADRSDVRIP
jgi:uncharacterized protein YicC (UPF0701 family)